MVSLYEMRIDNQIYLHFALCTFWEKVPKNTVALFGKKCPKIPLSFLKKSSQKYCCTTLLKKSAQKYRCTFWEKVPKNTVKC